MVKINVKIKRIIQLKRIKRIYFNIRYRIEQTAYGANEPEDLLTPDPHPFNCSCACTGAEAIKKHGCFLYFLSGYSSVGNGKQTV